MKKADRATTLRERVKQPTRLGRAIRLYRQVRERSIRDTAREIGVAAATLYRIEIGESIDAATMLVLWRWLFGSEGKEGARA